MRGMRPLAAVAAVATVFGTSLIFARPAHACGCETRDLDAELRDGGAVAVVTRTDAGETERATFRVEEALGSDLPATLTGEIDQCQPYVLRESVAALAFRRTGVRLPAGSPQLGGWTLPSCSALDLNTVLTRLHGTPSATSTRPAVAVAAGDFGGSRLVALDRRGEVVAWDRRPGQADLVVACPGGRTVVAYGRPPNGPLELTVHDAATLETSRTVPLGLRDGEYARSLRCDDAAGRVVRLLATDEAGDSSSRVLTVVGGEITSAAIEVSVTWVVPIGDGFLADVATGPENLPALVRIHPDGSASAPAPLADLGGVLRLAVSPDERTIALMGYEVSPPRAVESADLLVVTVDARTGRELARWRPDEYLEGIAWTPVGRLIVRSGYSGNTPPDRPGILTEFDRDLRAQTHRDSGQGSGLVTVGESVVTFAGTHVVAIPAAGAPRVVENLRLAGARSVVGLSVTGFDPGDAEPTPAAAGIVRAGGPTAPTSTDAPARSLLAGLLVSGAAAGLVGVTRRQRGVPKT